MTTTQIKDILRYLLSCVEHAEQLGEMHDCNDCKRQSHCAHVPKIGESSRINCFLWREMDDPKPGDPGMPPASEGDFTIPVEEFFKMLEEQAVGS